MFVSDMESPCVISLFDELQEVSKRCIALVVSPLVALIQDLWAFQLPI